MPLKCCAEWIEMFTFFLISQGGLTCSESAWKDPRGTPGIRGSSPNVLRSFTDWREGYVWYDIVFLHFLEGRALRWNGLTFKLFVSRCGAILCQRLSLYRWSNTVRCRVFKTLMLWVFSCSTPIPVLVEARTRPIRYRKTIPSHHN